MYQDKKEVIDHKEEDKSAEETEKKSRWKKK
jgi:hypothetical protein